MKKLVSIFILIFSIFLIFACETPLKVEIVSPKNNATIRKDFTLAVEGSSGSPVTSIILKIGSKNYPLDIGKDPKNPRKRWKISLDKVSEGKNTLALTVTNKKKEKKTARVTINVKKPDPYAISAEILKPKNNALLTKDFTLKVRVNSKKPVESYWFKKSSNQRWKQLPKGDAPNFKMKIKNFKDGEKIFHFTARNSKKYAKTAKVKVRVRKPLPVAKSIKIKILKPEKNERIKEKFNLSLKIDSKEPIEKIWYKHKATKGNWKILELNKNLKWKLDINEFSSGKQDITVTAYNGKEYGYARISVFIDKKEPKDKGPGFGNCYVYKGGFGGKSEDKKTIFAKPYYIQISNDRKLYVTDSRKNRVFVFDHTGKYIFSFGKSGSGPGQFDNPVGICIYKNERIFVSDYLNRRVGIFDIKGNFIKFFYGKSIKEDDRFKLTGGVAVNDNGELFVVDFDGHRIFKFDTAGNFKKVFGKKGSSNGELYNPTGITISLDGFLYITDKKNDRIAVFDTNGVFSFAFGRGGAGPGQFSRPMGIAVDKFNHIYVSDTRNNRIMKFDHRGKFICIVAKNLVNPIGVAIDNTTGIVYVVDRDASLIRMYKPCGK